MRVELDNVDLAGEYDIYAVKLDSGLSQMSFLPSQEILEEYVMGNDTPYYYGSVKKPLELEVTFAKIKGYWTPEDRRSFAYILDSDVNNKYIPMRVVMENEPRVYFVKYIGGVDIFTNTVQEGYLTVHFRCDSPYWYSNYCISIDDFSDAESNIKIFENRGNVICLPKLTVEKVGDGSISIQNTSCGGTTLVLNNLLNGEEVTIDNKFKKITSNLPEVYRYNDHNGVFLSMPYGINYLRIIGKCRMLWKYRLRFKG